jgi:hypothetical protein
MNFLSSSLTAIAFCLMMIHPSQGQNLDLGRVTLIEPIALARSLEYVEFELQNKFDFSKTNSTLVAVDEASGEAIICQVVNRKDLGKDSLSSCSVIFPVSMRAHEAKTLLLKVNQS